MQAESGALLLRAMSLLLAAPTHTLTTAPSRQVSPSICRQPTCPRQAWRPVSSVGTVQRLRAQPRGQLHLHQVEARRKLRAVPTGTTDASPEITLEESTNGAVVGTVTSVDKDTFWPIVKGAGDKLVVLDMYTQWYA